MEVLPFLYKMEHVRYPSFPALLPPSEEAEDCSAPSQSPLPLSALCIATEKVHGSNLCVRVDEVGTVSFASRNRVLSNLHFTFAPGPAGSIEPEDLQLISSSKPSNMAFYFSLSEGPLPQRLARAAYSLWARLGSHAQLVAKQEKTKVSVDVPYRLLLWGELVGGILGERTHTKQKPINRDIHYSVEHAFLGFDIAIHVSARPSEDNSQENKEGSTDEDVTSTTEEKKEEEEDGQLPKGKKRTLLFLSYDDSRLLFRKVGIPVVPTLCTGSAKECMQLPVEARTSVRQVLGTEEAKDYYDPHKPKRFEHDLREGFVIRTVETSGVHLVKTPGDNLHLQVTNLHHRGFGHALKVRHPLFEENILGLSADRRGPRRGMKLRQGRDKKEVTAASTEEVDAFLVALRAAMTLARMKSAVSKIGPPLPSAGDEVVSAATAKKQNRSIQKEFMDDAVREAERRSGVAWKRVRGHERGRVMKGVQDAREEVWEELCKGQ